MLLLKVSGGIIEKYLKFCYIKAKGLASHRKKRLVGIQEAARKTRGIKQTSNKREHHAEHYEICTGTGLKDYFAGETIGKILVLVDVCAEKNEAPELRRPKIHQSPLREIWGLCERLRGGR